MGRHGIMVDVFFKSSGRKMATKNGDLVPARTKSGFDPVSKVRIFERPRTSLHFNRVGA